MNEVKKGAFAFEGFKVVRFTFEEAPNPDELLNVTFEPHGLYDPVRGIFQLQFIFAGFHGEPPNITHTVVKADTLARFEFKNPTPLEELPQYFYQNAIAIVFPYLRAFVSTLTMQANAKQINLPVLNLSGLAEDFQKNTKVVEST